jgi:hypothetical protein
MFMKTKHTEDSLKQIVWGAVSEVSGEEHQRTEVSNCQIAKKEVLSNSGAKDAITDTLITSNCG